MFLASLRAHWRRTLSEKKSRALPSYSLKKLTSLTLQRIQILMTSVRNPAASDCTRGHSLARLGLADDCREAVPGPCKTSNYWCCKTAKPSLQHPLVSPPVGEKENGPQLRCEGWESSKYLNEDAIVYFSLHHKGRASSRCITNKATHVVEESIDVVIFYK